MLTLPNSCKAFTWCVGALQHQLYNQMLHCQTNDEWYKVEELLENLRKYALAAGVAGDFGWAVHTSIRSLVNQ